MALIESDAKGKDGVGRCYTEFVSKQIDAAKLAQEVSSILPQNNGDGKWHMTTAELAYGGGFIIQVRLRESEPSLSSGSRVALEQMIANHRA